jgi:hypothetical protein
MSLAFCNIISTIAAVVATTVETKVLTIQMAIKPAGASFLYGIFL